jgi:ribonuclease HII
MAAVRPTWRAERALWNDGRERVAGVDEVGRGPLAGPVVAAAVVLPFSRARWVSRLRDSKLLTARTREELSTQIRARCDFGVGVVSQHVIDQIGIAPATRLAMRRAVDALRARPDALIVDGREHVDFDGEQRSIVRADALCKSVAAASIVAKVERDAMMRGMAEHFPGYGLEQNKGYGSRAHMEALRTLGYSTAHRLSFAPVRAALLDG